jgi:hypothetical protein
MTEMYLGKFKQNCFNCGKPTTNLLGYCKKKCQTDHIKKHQTKYYINKKIQDWAKYLTDYFCLDHVPVVQYNCEKHNYGRCHWQETPIRITLNRKTGCRLQVLVHEFLHATGYRHEYEINGWANYGFGKGKDRDRFSTLIVRDLIGKDDLQL